MDLGAGLGLAAWFGMVLLNGIRWNRIGDEALNAKAAGSSAGLAAMRSFLFLLLT
jgi:hypothetical protein